MQIKAGDFVRCIERTETAAHLTGVYEVMDVRDGMVTLQNEALAYRANRFVVAVPLNNLREYFLYESQKEGWDALAARIDTEWLDNFINSGKESDGTE